MHRITGTGLLSLIADFQDRSKEDMVLAAGYRRDNGKPAYTAFYEEVLRAKGQKPLPGGIARTSGRGPAIYVACLASYNAGRLFGSWLDLSDGPDADDIREAIDAIIKESPESFAEEYAIHDSEELPHPLSGEWPDIDALANYCKTWADLDPDEAEAYRILCTAENQVLTEDEFRECFVGWYDSPRDFAMEWAEEIGLLKNEESNVLLHHVDWDGVWRELDADGTCATFVESRGMYLIHQ